MGAGGGISEKVAWLLLSTSRHAWGPVLGPESSPLAYCVTSGGLFNLLVSQFPPAGKY